MKLLIKRLYSHEKDFMTTEQELPISLFQSCFLGLQTNSSVFQKGKLWYSLTASHNLYLEKS